MKYVDYYYRLLYIYLPVTLNLGQEGLKYKVAQSEGFPINTEEVQHCGYKVETLEMS